jgi:hypothetical protein
MDNNENQGSSNKNIVIKNEQENFSQVENSFSSRFLFNLNHFVRIFFKVFGIRTVYSLFLLIKSWRKPYSKITFINIVKSIFNLPNLRTSLSVSILPFLFQNIKFIFSQFSFFKNYSNFTIFISGFISAFCSILIEEKTNLVNYIISSIMVRVIHSIILLIFKKYNVFQNTGKVWDYFTFLIASILIWTVYFLNPGYTPVTSMIDSYANYRNEAEKSISVGFRNCTRLV